MISYEPLRAAMKQKGGTTYTLIYKHGISAYTITNLRRYKSITMHTLERLCAICSVHPMTWLSLQQNPYMYKNNTNRPCAARKIKKIGNSELPIFDSYTDF